METQVKVETAAASKPEEGEVVEKSVIGILKVISWLPDHQPHPLPQGRNPVMFCNDQAKYRGLEMEWEQVRTCQAVVTERSEPLYLPCWLIFLTANADRRP